MEEISMHSGKKNTEWRTNWTSGQEFEGIEHNEPNVTIEDSNVNKKNGGVRIYKCRDTCKNNIQNQVQILYTMYCIEIKFKKLGLSLNNSTKNKTPIEQRMESYVNSNLHVSTCMDY